jgi:aldose 1-epimerase
MAGIMTTPATADNRSGRLTLHAGPATSAAFDPDDGARLVSLRFDGHELLRSADSRADVWFGGFPMVPWAGLLREARLEFDGSTYSMPTNWGADSLHGLLRLCRFEVQDGELKADFPPVWPFGGTLRMTPTLTAESLRIAFTVTAGDRRMPAAIGWHPWFATVLADGSPLSVTLPHDIARMERNDAGLPTGSWVEPGPGPWDDCFRTDHPLELGWSGVGSLSVHSSGGFVGVYDGEESGIAIEPMNAPAESLPHTLDAGESLTLTVNLEWSRS